MLYYESEGDDNVKKTKLICALTAGLIFWTVFSFVLAQQVDALVVESGMKVPKLEMSELKWDFGIIPRAGKVTHNYIIKNAGKDTLKIKSVHKSCGCTTVPLQKDVIPPGDTALLQVTFNAASYQGPVAKVIYLESNDPTQPLTDIEFTANVNSAPKPLSFEPLAVGFDTIRAFPAKIVLKVTNRDSLAVSFSVLEPPANYISVKTRKKTLAAGETAEVDVSVLKTAPAGEFNTSFTLACSDAQKTRYTLAISGFFIPEY